jgi:hypothetical protein
MYENTLSVNSFCLSCSILDYLILLRDSYSFDPLFLKADSSNYTSF